MKSKNVLHKVVNMCGKVVSERQERLSQLYECRVVRKARVIVDDNSHVLAKHYELLHLVDDFAYLNQIQSAVSSMKRQSCECVCECVCVCKLEQ